MMANALREDFPSHRADGLVARFWAGQLLRFSLVGNPNERDPDLEKLHTVDEVWALCFRSVRQNQWRLFGRFVEKNTFVGLALHRRSELGSTKNYGQRASEIPAEWIRVLGDLSFVRAVTIGEYLSGLVIDVDHDPP